MAEVNWAFGQIRIASVSVLRPAVSPALPGAG
jgi:hypothetical protein